MKITTQKKEILAYMSLFQHQEGCPPTLREICKAMGLSSAGSLLKHMRSMEKAGFIEQPLGKKRAWKLTDKACELIGLPWSPSIPLIGQIAAGTPILAEENREEELPIDPGLFGASEAFALRVRGDSMIDAHIRDGDLAVIRPQEDAEEGQVVAVMIEGVEAEATLKVFRRRNKAVELHAANPAYGPLIFKGKDRSKVKILGKLVGVIRPKP
jgi:repressor LexA